MPTFLRQNIQVSNANLVFGWIHKGFQIWKSNSTNFIIYIIKFSTQIQQTSCALSLKLIFLLKCPTVLLSDLFLGPAAAHLQSSRDSSYIPAESRLCSDMSLYSFGLEPLSCHAWNKDKTRRWNSEHTNLAAFPHNVTQLCICVQIWMYRHCITAFFSLCVQCRMEPHLQCSMQMHFLPLLTALMLPGEPQGI